MTDSAARDILVTGARALAHADGLQASLDPLLDSIAEQTAAGSAAVLVLEGPPTHLVVAASVGLPDAAVTALEAAAADPGHPLARTVATRMSSFDVLPTAPGGPALRSHVPLLITRRGSETALGVLALAHDRSIDPNLRPILQAGADLAAVAIESRRRAPHARDPR